MSVRVAGCCKRNCRRHWSALAVALALVSWLPCRAQDPDAPRPEPTTQQPEQPPPARREPDRSEVEVPQGLPQSDAQGKTVVDIRIEPATSADTILRIIKTKVGQPFTDTVVRNDIRTLWSQLKIYTRRVECELVDGGVRVYFLVDESRSFDRFEFHGLDHFKEREVRALLGIDSRQRVNRRAAEQYAATLRDRYHRDGYPFADVRIVENTEASTLEFWVDEGEYVTIREVRFVGDRAFPGWVPLGFSDNLIGSAAIASAPPGIFSGYPYSEEVVEEDLDKLRFFYRRKGYRDAQVELASVVFSPDHSEVDLTFRVIEGRRYRIASLDLVQVPPPDRAEPLYPKADILAELKIEPGDYYDHDEVQVDRKAITDFYGRRGHPLYGRYGRGIENAFKIGDPAERFDTEKAEVHLTFVVEEGTPKRLHDVIIRGNAYTRDRVVRRKVFLMPGDILDMTEVERSQRALDNLQYFQDPEDFSGVLFELLPVPGDPDQLDLAIDVSEGDTGSFLWGAGVSTATGVQARFVLSKRNFDISRLPSSFNPIDWFEEIGSNEAFHGAGQDLELMIAPGTEISLFSITFYEPDLFRQHFDTIGLRVQGYKRLQFWDSYSQDSLGIQLGLQRNFTEEFSAGVTFREETIDISDPTPSAPEIVWASEGKTEMRGIRLNVDYSSVDSVLAPSKGLQGSVYGELVGGPFGAQADFWKTGVSYTQFLPLYRDLLGRAHVLRWRNRFDYGHAFGDSDFLYLTERFYMGGSTLRGFDQRRAGPSQFGNPVGGEARFLSSLEYQFPIFSTRREGQLRETEVLRGVVFTDFGMLGLSIDDLGAPRLSAGVGIRLQLPLLNVPLALDLGWPIMREETDRTRQLFFSLSRF